MSTTTILLSPTMVTFCGFHLLVVALRGVASTLCFKPQLWHTSLALFWGLLIAFIDLIASGAQLPALLLLSSGFFLGFARPSCAWRWALLVATWIPAAAFVQFLFGPVKPYGHPAASLLAFVPALM